MRRLLFVLISILLFSCERKPKVDYYEFDDASISICDSMLTVILSYMPGFVPQDTTIYITPDSLMAIEDRDGRDMIEKIVKTARGIDTLFIQVSSHSHNLITSPDNVNHLNDIKRHNLLMKELFANNPRFKLRLPVIGKKTLFAEYQDSTSILENYGLTEDDIPDKSIYGITSR